MFPKLILLTKDIVRGVLIGLRLFAVVVAVAPNSTIDAANIFFTFFISFVLFLLPFSILVR